MQMNSNILSTSAQRVQDVLSSKNLPFTVRELSSSTRTANEAAATIGCEVAQIVKSLMFCTKQGKTPILILVSGINRVNERAIENLVGETIIKADADFTRAITGFAIGGVPPVGHMQKINHIFIDEDLMKYKTLWAAAGTPNAIFELYSADLEALTGGKRCAIK